VVDAVDVIVLVMVAALVSGNDRVVVIEGADVGMRTSSL